MHAKVLRKKVNGGGRIGLSGFNTVKKGVVVARIARIARIDSQRSIQVRQHGIGFQDLIQGARIGLRELDGLDVIVKSVD
jgi:hypothetical protein